MTQWVGDNWRLRAGPQLDSEQDQNESAEDDTKVDPELRLRGYKESFVREYDGIRVYHHQGRYQHLTKQFHYWAFYEYRMMINDECWNIITDEDMVKTPGSFPGSNSNKLTHDFCHLNSRYCDDVYFFPSNAFKASARSSNTFHCMLQTRVNWLINAHMAACRLRGFKSDLVKDLYNLL